MRNLKPLLSPRSVAVIGASEDNVVLDHLIRQCFPGTLLPVNPKYREVRGLRCYPTVGAAPGPIDLAVIAVPAAITPRLVEESGRAGVGALVIISSGFAETGPEGVRLQAQVQEIARRYGVPALGPNCLGFINAGESVAATISQAAMRPFGRPAPVAFVTQSGAFGTAIAAMAAAQGWTFRYFVNTGNEADLTCAEVIDHVLDDPEVKIVAGYIEGLRDGPSFLEAARKALHLDKPIACVKVGRSGAGRRAAASHTAAMAGADDVYDAALRQYGVIRAADETELLDLLAWHLAGRVPAGSRVAIVTMSGGAGVLMSDQCERAGLAVPELAPSTQEALRALLPAFGAYRNPVDLTAQFVMAPMEFRKILGEIAGDSGVDSIALFFNLIHQRWEPVVEAMHAVADEKQKPMAVAWVMPPEGAATRLHQVGIPMYPSSLRLVRALGHLAAYHQFRGSEVARDVLAMPPPAPTSEPVGAPRALAEHEAKRRLEAAGLPVTREILAGSVAEARAAAGAIGYPVVLKVQSAEIPHKTEVGGVRIGIRSDEALVAAYAAIVESARRFRPGVPIDGVLVQEQVEGAIGELLVGVARDPVFGPVLLCGLGGTLTEVFHDVSRRLLPVNRSQARAMLGELRCLPLFEGARGRPRGDLNAVVEVLVAVSHWALAEGERLLELDINPLMVMPEGRGALVADALIVEGKGGIA